MKKLATASYVFVFTALISLSSLAQTVPNKADVEKFYKPATAKDLRVYLSPQMKSKSDRFNSSDAVFSGSGGCPDQINIGSISAGSGFTGGTDINVSVQGDIIVSCNGFF